MNHPKPEEWMPYLYGESRPDARRQMKAHLRECPDCLEQVARWQASMKQLDRWKIPKASTAAVRSPVPVLRVAFAAALLVLAGFLAGSVVQSHSARLREGVKAELRNEFQQELVSLVRQQANDRAASTLDAAALQSERIAAAYVGKLQAQRSEDQRATEAAIQRLEVQRLADMAALKKELDTLAFNTDAGLRHTAQGLVQLANYSRSPSATENKTTQ